MAEILLELWKLDFDYIGSLGQDETTGRVSVDYWPLTLQMNELIRANGVDDCVPSRIYHNSAGYISALLGTRFHIEELGSSHWLMAHARGYKEEDYYSSGYMVKKTNLDLAKDLDQEICHSDEDPLAITCDYLGEPYKDWLTDREKTFTSEGGCELS
ncbi:hypothetical protein BBP40_009614 [Aspergillus hancockii]|nr:hypothetical protein BBP40_009614 [Aspergillus hancockii]